MSLPLSSLVVLEIAGLAPAPYAGMILADFGADVIRIDRIQGVNPDVLTRNKRSIALDLKNPLSIDTIKALVAKSDIILDPFRPGVMERLGLGPDVLFKENKRLIYARLSGFGQTGPTAGKAGHDLNYLAISGALEMMGNHKEVPHFPLNILADFAGGGMMCVMGILMALFERFGSGKGQVVDSNLTAGTAYLATFPMLMRQHKLMWEGERGTNSLDGGAHFYQVYRTKDNLFMAVACLEPQFYEQLLVGLGLSDQDLPDQHDSSQWPAMKQKIVEIFMTKTQSEWTRIFDDLDACTTPVLSVEHSVPDDGLPQSREHWPREASFPQPAPLLSRTPATPVVYPTSNPFLAVGKHSVEILTQFGFDTATIQSLLAAKAVSDTGLCQKM
ncbi:CoA-transferase family III domain-containing protein [Phycomyces nitens]|nr:CoA-transferase family III domain-containing protein [Phycomyces nitens]